VDVPRCRGGKIVVIILMTWLIALGDTTHIVVGSVEILYLVFNGTLHWSDFSGPLRYQRSPGISVAERLFSR
jgi:formate/nitrite transporter FocA (FNT family)